MIDPTIEFVEVELEGKMYRMCFDLEALCDAEEELLKQGIEAKLLDCLEIGNMTGNAVRTLFALSLRKAQPEMEYKTARKLVTHKNLQLIRALILKTWCTSVGIGDGDEKKEQPAETVETKPLENEISAEPNVG